MPDFTVDRKRKLSDFLARQGIQPYRVPVLLNCKALQVFREGKFFTPAKEDERVEEDDVIRIADPLPKTCMQALENIPVTDYRDYGFIAPGLNDFGGMAEKVFQRRPQTILIADTLVSNLSSFIKSLSKSTAIQFPIKDIFTVSHAHPEGWLQIQLETLDDKLIEYEDLEKAEKSKNLFINPAWITPRPKDPTTKQIIPFAFHIKGCRIGLTQPYLDKLKAALGGKVNVTAPKFFQSVAQLNKPPGFIEFMLYSFSLYRPQQIKDKTAAIKEFIKAEFTDVHGDKVSPKIWDSAVPKQINNKKDFEQTQLSINALIPMTGKKATVNAFFRYRKRNFLKNKGTFNLKSKPKNNKEEHEALKKELVARLDTFKEKHPFPMWIRYGYKTLDEFIEGWEWTFEWDEKNKLMTFNGVRFEYTVLRPIVDKKNNLYMNFYPSKAKDKPVIMLKEDDTKFYGKA